MADYFDQSEVDDLIVSDEDAYQDGGGDVQPASSKPYRYKDCDDINILKEVLVEKPSGKDSAQKWKRICDRLKIPVRSYVAIKTRYELLMKAFRSENSKSLRGSGLEEDYDEKVRLLTDIASQIDDWKSQASLKSKEKKKADEQLKKAQNIREAALQNMTEHRSPRASDDDCPTPKRSRHNSKDIVELIKSSEEKDRQQKDVALDLEKKRVELAERDMKVIEENEEHRRHMEREKLDFDRRRLELDEKKMDMEKQRHEKELEERSFLLQLLQKSFN